MTGHAILDIGDQFVGLRGDDCKTPKPFAGSRLFPVLPDAGKTEGGAVLHGDGVELFRLLAVEARRCPAFLPASMAHAMAMMAVTAPGNRTVPYRRERMAATKTVSCWMHSRRQM
jgi:hypothetical protein